LTNRWGEATPEAAEEECEIQPQPILAQILPLSFRPFQHRQVLIALDLNSKHSLRTLNLKNPSSVLPLTTRPMKPVYLDVIHPWRVAVRRETTEYPINQFGVYRC